MIRVISLELNEINFPFVEYYADKGMLPNFRRAMNSFGVARTTSESSYELLEPWIQWVTAHTGKSFDQHRVFRLGDIVHSDVQQVWETLERDANLTVAAVSPMNARNATHHAAFFVPDPWTDTPVTGSWTLRMLYKAIRQLVNDNAQGRTTFGSLFGLLLGFMRYARLKSLPKYLGLVALAKWRPWNKALILDRLLADVFIWEWRRHTPDYASLFLNAGAHIQHHYMFSAEAYKGAGKNPAWYVSPDLDPVLDVYRVYDDILGELLSFEDVRTIVATGLHQDPYESATFYYRLKDHEDFLRRNKVPFRRAEPRMSRDFLVKCSSESEAATAERRLSGFVAQDGEKLFEVDNRGSDLFVTLVYPFEIGIDFECSVDGEEVKDLYSDVAFVAIKNGEHNSIGYVIDTHKAAAGEEISLSSLYMRVMAAFNQQDAALPLSDR